MRAIDPRVVKYAVMLHSAYPAPALLMGTLALAFSSAFQVAAAGAAEPSNAIAVLPLEIEGNVPAGRVALESAVSRGLAVVSGPTISAPESVAKLTPAGAKVPCASEACWMAAGKAIAARYLVAGKVERKGPLFEVRFRLVDAPTGRMLATENNKCEVADCSVAELCRQTVRELVRQTLGDPTRAAMTEPPSVTTGGEAGGPAASASAGSVSPPAMQAPILDPSSPEPSSSSLGVTASAEPRASRIPPAVPIVAIAAGVLGLGAGAYYLKLEGDCATGDNPCQRHHRTLWGGLGLLSAGVALVGTGTVLAVLRARAGDEAGAGGDAAPVSISVGPGSAFVSGRF